jgi:hypothetical protein
MHALVKLRKKISIEILGKNFETGINNSCHWSFRTIIKRCSYVLTSHTANCFGEKW